MSVDTSTIHWFHRARSQADDPSHFLLACARHGISVGVFFSSPQFLDHGRYTSPGIKDIIHNQEGSIIGD